MSNIANNLLSFATVDGLVLDDKTRQAVTSALQGQTVLSISLAGSRAYGLEHADSDIDLKGIHQANARKFLSMNGAPHSLVVKDPDFASYELGRFFKLLVDINPTVLEQLYTPEFVSSPTSMMLRARRQEFLSAKLYNSYRGYAQSQYMQWKQALKNPQTTKARADKYLRHAFRLLEQGRHLLDTGVLEVRVQDPEKMWATADWDESQAEREFKSADLLMDAAASNTSLPEQANEEALDIFLADLRFESLDLSQDSTDKR